MPLQLFQDLPDLIDSWRHAISSLDHRSQEIFLELFLHGRTRSQIAAERGTSRQNIADIVDRAIARVRRSASSGDNPPIAAAIKNATYIIDAAGMELAFKLKRNPHHYSTIVAQQLTNISAISPGQEAWAMAVILITPAPNMPHPSLEGLANDARQVAGQHLRGISQRHLRRHLTTWDQRTAAWPNFDLRLHIAATTGNWPHPKTGRYHPIRGWTLPIHNDPLLTKHYTARAFDKAGQPLTIPQIVTSANRMARRDGQHFTYSERQVRSIINLDKNYKWVGKATWALRSWDVGHSQGAIHNTRRVKIADEILYVLQNAAHPVPYRQVKDHILSRFQVSENAFREAIRAGAGNYRFNVNPDRTITLIPPKAGEHDQTALNTPAI